MVPKYEKIKQDLLAEIQNNQFIPGDKFYSESDIKKKYNVSSITAVKALNELTIAGYLYRIQGKGTFVSKAKTKLQLKFSDIENYPLDIEHVEVISISEENSADIQQALGLSLTESYFKIIRVRYADEQPFLIHVTHLPKKFIKQPIADDLSYYSSIYQRIHTDFGIDLFSANSIETNEIMFLNDPFLMNLLQIEQPEPVVKQIKTSYLSNGCIAEYIVSYKHWAFFRTKIEVSRE